MSEWTIDRTFGCWRWTGKKSKDGYGLVWRGKKPVYAHRIVYSERIGPIAEGMYLDHLCRRRDCVNPDHLEPVDAQTNQWRKEWRYRVRQATCRNGHNLKRNAIITPEGGRLCRLCR